MKQPHRDAGPPQGRPLAATCGHLLRLAQQRHTAIWAEEVDAGLTGPQYAVLAALEASPGIDQRTAGALASLDRSSTTDVVTRLEARGLVTRSSDPRDARRDVLALTGDAAEAVRALHPRVARVQERLVRPVPPTERGPLVRDLTVLARVGAQAPATAPPAPLRIPGHLLRRAQQVHTALFAEEFDRELTGPQYAALHVLEEHPGISQRELGERAGLDRSTSADLVARLVRRGWVLRQRDDADGRRRVLTLAPDARTATAGYAPRVAAVQGRLLAPLDPSRRAAFLVRLASLAGLPTADT